MGMGQPVQRQHDSGATGGPRPSGVPINITDTSYDDVYGRMALLKVGAAYRITPRTEMAFNFVFSESAAETVDHRHRRRGQRAAERGLRGLLATGGSKPASGSSSPASVSRPMRVTWSASTGMATSEARSSNVPSTSTPGLAAQDGKFFEKSWALSLGPTGGMLVGLGPFELMFETQLRYTGGLSDVDWLVEEGLQDINERELALVASVSARRQDPVLTTSDHEAWTWSSAMLRLVCRTATAGDRPAEFNQRCRRALTDNPNRLTFPIPGRPRSARPPRTCAVARLRWRLTCLFMNGGTKSPSR